MTKAIAYYLPQFHEIEENNEWWGKGFTEWTNLRKAKPVSRKHRIIKPLGEYYYDLMDKSTVEWQTNLAEEYGLYAFNYYHYWFKGRKILEKPAENLLGWKDIRQRFMFMWANHDWTRSWVGGREILLKLEYGVEADWKEHIDYLIPFFLDDRYVKVNGKPVFQIYIRKAIPRFEEMIALWDAACRDAGLPGIYIVDNVDYNIVRNEDYSPACDAITLEEHSSSVQYALYKKPIRRLKEALVERYRRFIKAIPVLGGVYRPFRVKTYRYDENVAASIELMRKLPPSRKAFFGVCTGWDNTPRYGRNGYIVEGASPAKFKAYLQAAKDLSEERGQEFVFVACWNEWCEGMCLEPNDKDGYGYLEALRDVFHEGATGA